MPRVIFHVDMDAFFASVEQRDDPGLKGKPVIVGAPPNRRGVVCAASYEARKFGVRSAMPSRTAQRLCPQGVFVSPRMERYREESRRIFGILGRYTPKFEPVSVDEAYMDMSGWVEEGADWDEALKRCVPVAERLKAEIFGESGLTASVGVAGNKFLAKLGSDFRKPDGLTLILESEKVGFLRPLSVRAIHGVGPVTAGQLEGLGLKTIGDLQDTPLPLEGVLGGYASRLLRLANGEDERGLDLSRERKTISSERTFERDTEDRGVLRGALWGMAQEVVAALAGEGVGALTVQVKVRYGDFRTVTRQMRVEEAIYEVGPAFRCACFLLGRHGLVGKPLRLLGVGLSNFVPIRNMQMKLSL